jgi:lipoate---protein ligase
LQKHPELPIKWRVLPLTIADQQQHIDQSERLLAEAEAGQSATLYWSMAQPAGLVLGFSQKPTVLNQESLVEHPLPVYHRRAGGTAVLAGPQLLSLDVVLPAGHPLILDDIIETYRWFGEAWMQALLALGILTRTVPPDEAHEQKKLLKLPETSQREALLRRACYGSLSPYEVVVGQRKLVGLDMIRRRVGTLLQAGVLLHWETETLAQLLGHSPEEQDILRTGLLERAIGLDTLAGRSISAREVISAFEDVIFTMYGDVSNT